MPGYTFTFEVEDKRYQGTNAIKDTIKKKIEGAAIVLVLIGNDTHNHDWIKLEVEYAHSFHKKICCIRVPGTRGKKPAILNNYKELPFSSNQLLRELNQY